MVSNYRKSSRVSVSGSIVTSSHSTSSLTMSWTTDREIADLIILDPRFSRTDTRDVPRTVRCLKKF